MDTRKRICANDLFNGGNDILSAYFNFKDKVLSSYVGLNYEKEKFKNEYELKPRNNILGEDD